MCKHTHELETMLTVTKRTRKFHGRPGLGTKDRVQPTVSFITLNTDTLIRERLSEIESEYDEKLDECHMVLSGLNFTTQMASGHVARHQTFANTRISIETKRDNAQMRSIALVTMVYLPLTSVAVSLLFDILAIGGGLTLLTLGLWWALTQRNSCAKEHHEANEAA
ncbi:hypothetical protein K445DRAFT_380161 [Daldinia sp. EC12]|nr:hypothetical protein K445DRAFT_380161 [Daldinia sp. EC12]